MVDLSQWNLLRWIKLSDGSKGNVISNPAPVRYGGCTLHLSRASRHHQVGCRSSVIHFTIVELIYYFDFKIELSAVTRPLLPNKFMANIESIRKSEGCTPWRNKFPRGFILRNLLFTQFHCIFGRNLRVIFGQSSRPASYCNTTSVFITQSNY